MQDYVVGFYFRNSPKGQQVALIRKLRPNWQAGHLNGVGGKVEKGEQPWDAMQREFREETGHTVTYWRYYAWIQFDGGIVHLFTAFSEAGFPLKRVTDERVDWYLVNRLSRHKVIHNVHWLLSLALDPGTRFAHIDTRTNC